MYVRANGRDITTNIESDPNFVLRTVNFTVSEDNGTVEASFVQSGRHLNNENIIIIRQISFNRIDSTILSVKRSTILRDFLDLTMNASVYVL